MWTRVAPFVISRRAHFRVSSEERAAGLKRLRKAMRRNAQLRAECHRWHADATGRSRSSVRGAKRAFIEQLEAARDSTTTTASASACESESSAGQLQRWREQLMAECVSVSVLLEHWLLPLRVQQFSVFSFCLAVQSTNNSTSTRTHVIGVQYLYVTAITANAALHSPLCRSRVGTRYDRMGNARATARLACAAACHSRLPLYRRRSARAAQARAPAASAAAASQSETCDTIAISVCRTRPRGISCLPLHAALLCHQLQRNCSGTQRSRFQCSQTKRSRDFTRPFRSA